MVDDITDPHRSRLSTDTALAVALVPYFSPKHHPQATRLLKGVLDAQPTNSEARFARAQILQTAGKWTEAQKNFQIILDQGGEEKDMVAAKEELGWCLINQDKLQDGRNVLEEVVELRDSRKEKLEEGKEDDEAFVRARAWWRLGQTEWRIGGESSLQFVRCGLTDNQTPKAKSMLKIGLWHRCVRYRPTLPPTQRSGCVTPRPRHPTMNEP